MPTSTDVAHRQRLSLAAIALLAILALGGWTAAQASADGDPASDVLAAQQLFLPQDAMLPSRQQAQLADLLREATRRGYPIHVALIASATDLGSVTALWREPQSYARFLGQELELVSGAPLLVVMPNGFGLYRASAAEHAALNGARPRGGLGPAAINAIRSLAAAAGHPLALPGGGTSNANAGGGTATPWIAFAAGLVLIALAWAASLRARPLSLRGR
jgi:hypothetical protein